MTWHGTITIRFEGDSEEAVEKLSAELQARIVRLGIAPAEDVDEDIWSDDETA